MEPVISDMAADTTKRQQIQQSSSRATLQEKNKGGDAVGEDDKGKIESIPEQ